MLTKPAIVSFFFAAATTVPRSASAASSTAFSYEPNNEFGPANWGNLPIDGNACNGQSNSPIAVTSRPCDRFEDYKMNIGSCRTNDLTFELTSTGVQASYPEEDLCMRPDVIIPGLPNTYEALQFHIHMSSEHTIDGKFFGAELHTVHQEIGGDRFAVVGMMIQPDAAEINEMFQALLDGFQAVYDENKALCDLVNAISEEPVTVPQGNTTANGGNRRLGAPQRELQPQTFAPYQLIPRGSTFYHYDGGLTTPPCSEVVWWNLADTPVSITPGQYFQLAELVLGYVDTTTCQLGTFAGSAGSTSRPVQPLNGRTVERICPVGFRETDC